MKLASPASFRVLVFLMPVLLLVLARGLLLSQAEGLYDHLSAIRSLNGLIRGTGVHIRELPEMRSDFELLARKKTEIASSLLGAKSEAALYDLLMLKARETGVSIAAIAPRPPRTAPGYAELPVGVEARGGYNDLGHFINALEGVDRLMRIEELSMARERSGVLTAAIRLTVFRQADTLSGEKGGKGRREADVENREQYLADLTNALAVSIPAAASSYSVTRQDDPFGVLAAPAPRQTTGAGGQQRPAAGLSLKGILWKNPPLAILESLDGRTYIVRQGDSAAAFRIVSITRTDVEIVSQQGTYVLHQYDQK